jgi:hypothetical protein
LVEILGSCGTAKQLHGCFDVPEDLLGPCVVRIREVRLRRSLVGSALVNSGAIASGGSFALFLRRRGRSRTTCLFHNAAKGMVSTITVTP